MKDRTTFQRSRP